MGPRWVPAALPHHHLLALPGASDPAGCFLLFLLLFFCFGDGHWRVWFLNLLRVCVCVLPVSVLANDLHVSKNYTKTNKTKCNQWPCFTKLTGHFLFCQLFFFFFPSACSSVLQFNFKCIYKICPKCNWGKYFERIRAVLENLSFSNQSTVLYGLWK